MWPDASQNKCVPACALHLAAMKVFSFIFRLYRKTCSKPSF